MEFVIQQLIDHLKSGGDYSTLDLTACEVTPHTNYYRTMYSDERHDQFNWYHLSPGSAELEVLNTDHDGSFSDAEALNERQQAWPSALDVSFLFLRNEAAHRGGKTFTTCAFCPGVAYDFCNECSRAVCVIHYKNYDGYDRPFCPDHFDAALDERKKRERLQRRLSRMQRRA